MQNENQESKYFVEFYIVDDVPVCVWGDGEDVVGFVVTTGYPYPPMKALNEGRGATMTEVAILSNADKCQS